MRTDPPSAPLTPRRRSRLLPSLASERRPLDMARTRTPLVLLATLTLGVFLGVAFDRGGPYVAAQATRPPLAGPTAPAGAVSPGTTAQIRSEEADYQRLARQY